MGWTVLYTAFGIVALWLLGEVLLQYKARLRWRLLAFFGFLGVVLGVLLPSVAVIAVGATAFAIGQTCVTLSFRRGFSAGWSLGGRPGSSRRRKSSTGSAAAEPTPEASEQEELHAGAGPLPEEVEAPQGPWAFPPESSPDESDHRTAYDDSWADSVSGDGAGQGAADHYGYYGSYVGYGQDADYGQAGYPGQDGQYAYGTAHYAAYADPYLGTHPGYGTPETYGQQYSPEEYAADPYPAASRYDVLPYDMDTPPGGIWVPQQRGGEQPPAAPPGPDQQPHPYPTAHNNGYDDQYRY